MEEKKPSDELLSFLDSGIYRLDGSNAAFMDPVRLLNDSYTRLVVSPSSYYSRSFESSPTGRARGGDVTDSAGSKKKKKKKKKKKRKRRSHDLNEREKSAEKRHQEARSLLLNAHEAFLGSADLISFLPNLVNNEDFHGGDADLNFIELGSIWQAPLYEISLCFSAKDASPKGEGSCLGHHVRRTILPIFNSLVSNETYDDVEAEFLNSSFILPRRSCFYMSDLKQIHDLISDQSNHAFNLIVIDPPWENGSAYQKSVYPTLPNRYFMYLPVKQLAHTEGALVVLWITNKEKLRVFVEKELFPAWGVTNVTLFYWLKVKPDGSLIGELDLFHHRPYECLLLGYINGENIDSECRPTFKYLRDNQVIISIPGAHSRKPPLGKLLLDYIPGPRPSKCIELFARELVAGWASWGNEPLRFQDSIYFAEKNTVDNAV